jgi:hypothetical protein
VSGVNLLHYIGDEDKVSGDSLMQYKGEFIVSGVAPLTKAECHETQGPTTLVQGVKLRMVM